MKNMISVQKKYLPCLIRNKVKLFSFASIAVSSERMGGSGFEFGRVIGDWMVHENPWWSRHLFLGWPVTDRAT